MQQYFIEKVIQNQAVFYPEDEHHILHVMRMRDYAKVVVVYETKKFFATLRIQQGKLISATIDEPLLENNELPVNITLIYSMPKKEKWDLILQKATELGVTAIVPLLSKRSMVKMDNEPHKMKRWQRIVKEAAEQSKRNIIPTITPVISNKDIASYVSDLNLVADESIADQPVSLHHYFAAFPQSISLLVGCEGGFEPQEINWYHEKGFQSVSLGKRILRSETAVLFLLSNVCLLLESENV